MRPSEFNDEKRNTKRENEASAWLRSQDEYAKFEFIWDVLKVNQLSGLKLVKKAQLKRAHLEVILEYGLVYGDVSSVKLWYQATVNGLGELRSIDIVAAHLHDGPLVVRKMLYWLRPKTEKGKQKFAELKAAFNEVHPNFKSNKSTGIHATGA